MHKKPEIAPTNSLASGSTEIPFAMSCLLLYLGMSTHTSALFSLKLIYKFHIQFLLHLWRLQITMLNGEPYG